MKKIILVLFMAIGLSGCSNTENNLGFLNAIANFNLLQAEDENVNAMYQKYSALLNESERATSESAYAAIKKAGEKPDIQTPVNYLIAKNSYISVIPIYQKYKGQIEKPDQVYIEGVHQKLKSIAIAVDQAIDNVIKNDLQLEYIKTASLLISAFS